MAAVRPYAIRRRLGCRPPLSPRRVPFLPNARVRTLRRRGAPLRSTTPLGSSPTSCRVARGTRDLRGYASASVESSKSSRRARLTAVTVPRQRLRSTLHGPPDSGDVVSSPDFDHVPVAIRLKRDAARLSKTPVRRTAATRAARVVGVGHLVSNSPAASARSSNTPSFMLVRAGRWLARTP